MKRSHIPLKVRLAVLERQAFVDREFSKNADRIFCIDWYKANTKRWSRGRKIMWLIRLLFNGEEAQLDHDPALVLRRINPRTGKYIPDANNPAFLVYRRKADHLHKTVGRKPGAERTVTSKGSDAWLAKKFRRLENPKKSKSKIPSRPFSSGKRSIRGTRSSFATRAEKDS